MDKLTREQAAVIGAYTRILAGPFEDMHELVERVLNRPVQTFEFADPQTVEEIKTAVKPLFIEICTGKQED